ncbi:MAG: hypothetical protein ACRDBO_20820 [Lachnospiraceae bacterium]
MMKTDGWEMSGNYWYYLDSQGMVAKDGFVNELDGRRYYVDVTGKMLSGTWIQVPGASWYFAGNDGVLFASMTTKIDGSYYTFDDRGKCMQDPSTTIGVSDYLYTNTEFKYAVTVPANASSEVQEKGGIHIEVEGGFCFIDHFVTEPDQASTRAAAYYNYFIDAAQEENGISVANEEEVQMGGYSFWCVHFYDPLGMGSELYLSVRENGYLIIYTGYLPEQKETIQNIVNSLTAIQ